jgi:hypothetical protein
MRDGAFVRYEARGVLDVMAYAATYRELITRGA